MEKPILIPTAEPFFFPGGETGCLLLHGFPGTPKEMRKLGEFLSEKGYSILAPRLAGHATQPEDIRRMRWWDWLACAEDGYHLLKGASENIYLIGLSLGGVLSLLLASRFDVAGAVIMSTPYDPPDDPRIPFVNILKWIIPMINPVGSDWQDKEAEKTNVHYPEFPSNAVIQLIDIYTQMRAAIPKVRCPTLLMHSRRDKSVSPTNMQSIYDNLGSQTKDMLWLQNSGHNLVRDVERERVFQACHHFIRGFNRSSQ
ncbi:MAG: alpha/beta fold hydrolase [Anaerolineales bacterium]|jgi:carboxylesterase